MSGSRELQAKSELPFKFDESVDARLHVSRFDAKSLQDFRYPVPLIPLWSDDRYAPSYTSRRLRERTLQTSQKSRRNTIDSSSNVLPTKMVLAVLAHAF